MDSEEKSALDIQQMCQQREIMVMCVRSFAKFQKCLQHFRHSPAPRARRMRRSIGIWNSPSKGVWRFDHAENIDNTDTNNEEDGFSRKVGNGNEKGVLCCCFTSLLLSN